MSIAIFLSSSAVKPNSLALAASATGNNSCFPLDAHFHIIDFDFPITENQGYVPPSYVVKYCQKETTTYPIVDGAVVSGSFQGFDQEYLVNALEKMGSAFCGVTQLPFSAICYDIPS